MRFEVKGSDMALTEDRDGELSLLNKMTGNMIPGDLEDVRILLFLFMTIYILFIVIVSVLTNIVNALL